MVSTRTLQAIERVRQKAGPYVLEIEGIRKEFPGVVALDNVQFRLKPGTVHALMGENGAGKSTLMKIIAGIYTPDRGTIRLSGEEVELKGPLDALERGIAMIDAEADPGSAFVGQFGLGKHGVLFQVGQLRFQQFAGHGHEHAVTFEQNAETRLHPALLRATRAEAGLGIAQVIEVAGQLTLQELAGIRAADRQNTFMRQRAEKSRIGHGSSQGKESGGHDKGALLKWVVHKGSPVPDQSRLFYGGSACILAFYLRSAPWSKMLNSIVCTGTAVAACLNLTCCWCLS